MGQRVMSQKIIKNFLVTGTPRSCTTWFCKTLNAHDGIWVPEFTNYEPFNPHGIPKTTNKLKVSLFDQFAVIDTIKKEAEKKDVDYLGIKTFNAYHHSISDLIDAYDFSIFLLLRKNIWKVLGSLLVAVDNKNFEGSSKRFEPYFFENSNREKRRILTIFDRICLNYWLAENYFCNHRNFIEKIYMEDIINGQTSSEKINNFFAKDIDLSNDYKEDDLSFYYKNFDEFKNFIVSYCKSAHHHYSALPDYILKELDL
jgi:hypothetical protein